MLAASLHFALSSCQPLLFVALLMEERLVLRAGVTAWLVCGIGESCWGPWSAEGDRWRRYGHLLTCPPLAYTDLESDPPF